MPEDAYTVEIDLPIHKRGDRWAGIALIGPVEVDGAVPVDTLTRIRMQFRNRSRSNRDIVYTLDSNAATSPDALIVIDDAVNWEASIAEPDKFINQVGPFDWDMEFYSTAATLPMTFYKGTLMIVEDVTN